jgi:hypothetical protein
MSVGRFLATLLPTRLAPTTPNSGSHVSNEPNLFAQYARKTNRYTWAPNGSITTVLNEGTGLFGTEFLTVCCPDDFYAVRVGFPNLSASPLTLPSVMAAPSDSVNDLCNPTGGFSAVPLTFANGGADIDKIVTVGGAPQAVTVRPNNVDLTSGEARVPAWTWTDWVNCNSAPPDPVTNMRVLMIRHTVKRNQGQPITFANGNFGGWSGVSTIHKGYDVFHGGINNGTDHSMFDFVPKELASVNSLTNGPIAACVQFMTAHSGVTGMTTGDSHHSGVSTTASFHNYLNQAVLSVGQKYAGIIPFGSVNCANGGTNSQQFFPYLQSLLPFVNPTFVVLPGWSYNEVNGEINADSTACNRFFARLLQVSDVVRMSGAIPIFLTPFPRDDKAMLVPQVKEWLKLRRSILDMRLQGEIVIDAAAALGRRTNSVLDGTYIQKMTTDNVHPNDVGHAAVAALLCPIIEAMGNTRRPMGAVQTNCAV